MAVETRRRGSLRRTPCSGSRFRAGVLELVNYGPFHPAQRGVEFLEAVRDPPPQWETGKRHQFARSVFLDQFELRLELLDVLGIIEAPFVGRTRAPDVRARSFHNEGIADVEDHLAAR